MYLKHSIFVGIMGTVLAGGANADMVKIVTQDYVDTQNAEVKNIIGDTSQLGDLTIVDAIQDTGSVASAALSAEVDNIKNVLATKADASDVGDLVNLGDEYAEKSVADVLSTIIAQIAVVENTDASVATDGVTISGNGTDAAPLKIADGVLSKHLSTSGGAIDGVLVMGAPDTVDANNLITPLEIKTDDATYLVKFGNTATEDAFSIVRNGNVLFQIGYLPAYDVWYMDTGEGGRIGSATTPLKYVYANRLMNPAGGNGSLLIPSTPSLSGEQPTLTAAVNPTSAGTYVLKMTVSSSGAKTTSWVKQ